MYSVPVTERFVVCTEELVPKMGQPPGCRSLPLAGHARAASSPVSRELQHGPSAGPSQHISWAQARSSLLLGRCRAEVRLCWAADRQRHAAPPTAYAHPGSVLRLCGCSGFPLPVFGDTIRHCKESKPNHSLHELA